MIKRRLGYTAVAFAMVFVMAQAGGWAAPDTPASAGLIVGAGAGQTTLSLGGADPFHRTDNELINARLIDVPGSTTRLVLWAEVEVSQGASRAVPYYAISLDGQTMATVRRTSYELKLRHGDFDPALRAPQVNSMLFAGTESSIYIVQFVTQPLEEFRVAIRELGGTVHHFLANHAHIVEMPVSVRDEVASLPFVRWVGPYHPAYRLDELLRDGLVYKEAGDEAASFHIQTVRRTFDQKMVLADRIRGIGGTIEAITGDSSLVDASLTPPQLLQVVQFDEVFFVDRKLPPQTYMNNVRINGGADHIETVGGYTGLGVRGEVMDSGLMTSHADFQHHPPLIHSGNGSSTSHGTSVYGINFGDGTGDATGRGMLPDAQGIFCGYSAFGDRYTHTLELISAPWFAVYQTHSWGSCCTTQYGSECQLMDEMIFDSDLIILQAQANDGSQNSDVSAWAKNVVSVGGIRHYDTLVRTDDQWVNAGSIGPAADGRIKPDLSYWYDNIRTTSNSGGYTSSFGGTSAATPETAGHFGLLFQMWADGIFGNEVDPGGTVFSNRPHAATAKALMINTANQYPFTGTSHDLTRVHQGWGTSDVGHLYDMRDKLGAVDEAQPLANLETANYTAYVDAGEPALRVTMVYTDPPGTTSSSLHRINDLTLKVTSPSAVVYWGNNGLLTGNWSVAGGVANTIDTVENVFVENPEAGIWDVQIIASEVNQDSHVETPELDADFALVISGGYLATCTSAGRITLDRPKYPCGSSALVRVVDCDVNTDDGVVETVSVNVTSDSEPAGETLLLTETAPNSARFEASLALEVTDAAGVLLIAEGDVVTASYLDADDGEGGINVTVTAMANIDCSPPVISNVQAIDVQPRAATIEFNTDEPAAGTVRYGTTCGSLGGSAGVLAYSTTSTIEVTGLQDATTYFYAVDAEDQAGNLGSDDNGGACYTFMTPDIPDFFTEQFDAMDLDNLSITLTLNGTVEFYDSCVEPITALPTDPTGGTNISLSDDSNSVITFSGGQTVSLYGTSYASAYVGSNGYITFGGGDTDYSETLADHFSMPRISGVFDDLNPSAGGTISWKQDADHVTVTYLNVAEYGTSNSNTFQIEMFFDGTIRLNYLAIAVNDCISGISAGNGLDPDFIESDLSASGECAPPDCDGNGIPDDEDIANCPGDIACADCNGNGIPDGCEIDGGTAPDCNGNAIPDSCDIAACGGDIACADCNGNGVPDGCDVGGGSAPDCNGNSIPDSCDIANCAGDIACEDCNGNGVPDGCDVAGGAGDCDGNAVPDSCDLAGCSGDPACGDCNGNSVLDGCDIAGGGSPDDNGNGTPDECDLASPSCSYVGSRYIGITPLPADLGLAVALRLTGDAGNPDVACVSVYVQADGSLDATPVYQTPAAWGTLYAYGDQILPGTSYEVRAELAGGASSPAGSGGTWPWGDIDNNGTVNFFDIMLTVQGFQGDFTLITLEAVDLEPCVPNGIINFEDINQVVWAFQGQTYADTGCAVPCN